MHIIGELVRNMAAMLLLAAVLEMLIPPGPLARFVRLILGLSVVALLFLPLLELRGTDIGQLLPVLGSEADAPDYAAQGQALGAELEQQALAEYSSQLGEQAAALAELADGVAEASCQAQVGADGRTIALTLELVPQPGAGPGLAEETAAWLRDYYGLEAGAVSCRLAGAGEVREDE